jgi:O-methyltransferase
LPLVHSSVDLLTSDGVAGWAFSADGPVRVTVLVDGRAVGEPPREVRRHDVHALNPEIADSLDSGFVFAFRPAHFDHVRSELAEVTIRFEVSGEHVFSDPVRVPILRARTDGARAALPPSVVRVLPGGRSSDGVDTWDEERAIADLTTIVRCGSKHEPALYRYLGYLAQVWSHALFVERHFPRINPRPVSGQDAIAVQSSPDELLAIAAHLANLRERGLDGALLEFGCFKGYSTCVLSFACAQLGATMEVFDSFQGLPASESGAYSSNEFVGELNEVKQNVAGFGRLESVNFHKGFFAESLARWEPDDVALVWMDVDLESSSRDVMRIFEHIPRESAIFSHECFQANFVDGRVIPIETPEAVLRPVVEAYEATGRTPTGRFISGNTGVVWDREVGVPVLSHGGLMALKDLAVGSY